MNSYGKFRKQIKAHNQKIAEALIKKDHSSLKKLLDAKWAAPFTIAITALDVTKDKQDLSFKILNKGEEHHKILHLIHAAMDKTMLERNLESVLLSPEQLVLPLAPELRDRLLKTRLVQLIGMSFPYFIEILPPHKSLINLALDHYTTENFQCLLNSPQMNAANLFEPGKKDSPLIHAINKKNMEAVERILSSKYLSLTLLRKNKRILENTALGKAIITGQIQIVEKLLKKTHALYQDVFSINYRERPIAVTLFYQDTQKCSALSLAAAYGKTSILKKLLTLGGKQFERFPTYLKNAMIAAIESRQAQSTALLMDSGLYPATQKEFLQIKGRAHPELRKYVLHSISIKCKKCLAVLMNSTRIQDHCLSNMTSNFLLLKAVECGDKAIVQTILEHPYLKKFQSETLAQRYSDTHYHALHLAVLHNFQEIAEYLANYYPPFLTRQDIQFHTPIHLAAMDNNLPLLRVMLNERTVDTEVARLISSILQRPCSGIASATIDFLRTLLIEFDRRRIVVHAGNTFAIPRSSDRPL